MLVVLAMGTATASRHQQKEMKNHIYLRADAMMNWIDGDIKITAEEVDAYMEQNCSRTNTKQYILHTLDDIIEADSLHRKWYLHELRSQ